MFSKVKSRSAKLNWESTKYLRAFIKKESRLEAGFQINFKS